MAIERNNRGYTNIHHSSDRLMTSSLFEPAAVRMGRQQRERESIRSTIAPRIQTDDSSRLNAYLISKGYTQDQINDLIHGYELITNAKRQLGIKQ